MKLPRNRLWRRWDSKRNDPNHYPERIKRAILNLAKDPSVPYADIAKRLTISRNAVSAIAGKRKPGPRSLAGLRRIENKALTQSRLHGKFA